MWVLSRDVQLPFGHTRDHPLGVPAGRHRCKDMFKIAILCVLPNFVLGLQLYKSGRFRKYISYWDLGPRMVRSLMYYDQCCGCCGSTPILISSLPCRFTACLIQIIPMPLPTLVTLRLQLVLFLEGSSIQICTLCFSRISLTFSPWADVKTPELRGFRVETTVIYHIPMSPIKDRGIEHQNVVETSHFSILDTFPHPFFFRRGCYFMAISRDSNHLTNLRFQLSGDFPNVFTTWFTQTTKPETRLLSNDSAHQGLIHVKNLGHFREEHHGTCISVHNI